jgi:hypothetical protein
MLKNINVSWTKLMRILISMILLFSSYLLKAQDNSELSEDSIRIIPEKNVQLYIAPSYSVNQFVETSASFAGISLGLSFWENFEINVSYSRILNNFVKQIIFPSSHKYDQKNLGIHGQYSFLNTKIRPLVGLGMQYGIVSWNPEIDSNDTFIDHIYIYNVLIGANWSITKTFSLQGNLGYNFTNDVDIIGFDSNDYDGFSVNLILKINLLKF